MAATSRMIFAMSRDERFPGQRLFKRVNPRTSTPIPATVLQLGLGIALIMGIRGTAMMQLILAGAILVTIPYAMTVVLYLVVRGKLDRKGGAFNLGRFEVPVAIAALVWLLAAAFVSIVSAPTIVPVLIVVGMLAIGGAYLTYLMVCRRDVLEVEPGGDSLAG
jgi:amino acid transporter